MHSLYATEITWSGPHLLWKIGYFFLFFRLRKIYCLHLTEYRENLNERKKWNKICHFIFTFLHTYTQHHWQRRRQGVVENNAGDTIWDAWPGHQDRSYKYLEAQQIFLWFYIPNFQHLCLSLLLLISSLLHDSFCF